MSELTLNEDWTAGIGGGLWSTGVAMAKYFERPEVVERLRGKRCLELGSGNGFLGAVLASTVDDCTVTVTDTEEHLELMRRTVEENKKFIVNCDERVKVEKLMWGEEGEGGGEKYDFVFGTDVAYRDYLHTPLIDALTAHMGKGSTSLIGICMHDTTVKFFEQLEARGFVYERLRDCMIDEKFRGTIFGLFAIEKKSS
ncbi:hypothetical protein TrCOL_g3665 [Triparma columacea]|uniref:Uncharacterized protein n=1 Tax=Triparma columacea TaxID=722753 RepID=A0A9W7GM44_9STRA|nr:hypothetical protein TrCOL_g3665 [Triparma columacea]